MILLAPPERRAVRRAVTMSEKQPLPWAYLGASVRLMRRVEEWLGADAPRLCTSRLLQTTARSLRSVYIDYIGELGKAADSPAWWFGSLSEKNPAVSKAFLHICYLAVAAELCRTRAGAPPLLLVVENRGVRTAIAAHLREQGARFTEVRESVLSGTGAAARDWVEMPVRRFYWLGRQLVRMGTARVLGFSAGAIRGAAPGNTRRWLLLHNWVDARSFDAGGVYRDVIFGPLREDLQKRGLSVAVVATILSRAPYRRILSWLKQSGIPVLVPEASLTLGALLRWAWKLPVRPPKPRAWPRFDAFDASVILAEAERVDWLHPRAADVLLLSGIVRRWSRHFDVQSLIYPYEGQSWERGYCRAMREHFPQAALVGYQHATVSPLWLSFFISPREWGKVPFPDRLIANGPRSYDLLRSSRIPERVLARGGALRYGALGADAVFSERERSTGERVRVLVTPSVLTTQAAELALAALRAFTDPRVFQVTIKFHPYFPSARVLAEAGLDRLPSHVAVSTEPMAILLRDTDVLVYTDATTAVEALAYGVPVVHFESNCEIDMDSLADFDDVRVSVETPAELRSAALAAAHMDRQEYAARVRRWREVVDLLLPRPDGKTIDLFMPDGFRREQSEAGQAVAKVQ
ncbi:MAG: hypothetical protein EPO02_09410 [Nitrospirae bacterium]|nr:MAG: hypothetical protein EPO02_09410 [Nitrospirota bacterium]